MGEVGKSWIVGVAGKLMKLRVTQTRGGLDLTNNFGNNDGKDFELEGLVRSINTLKHQEQSIIYVSNGRFHKNLL